MKKITLLFLALTALLFSDTFDSGLKAYKSKDFTKAFSEFTLCHTKRDCQGMMALMYQNGEGVTMDIKRAKEWYEKSANQGELSSMHNLGVLYLNEKKYKDALPWFKKAAQDGAGYTPSIYNLGLIYLYGWGVRSDYALSLKYMKLAKNAGYKQANEVIEYLEKELKNKPTHK